MGSAVGHAAHDVVATPNTEALLRLQEEIKDYNFYQLVDLLARLNGWDLDQGEQERNCSLIYRSNPSLGFSPSDVSDMSIGEANVQLVVNFFGMSGAQSPLPGYITEQLLIEEGEGLKAPFFDFFSNRLIHLVYQIWKKYRYYIRFKAEAEDAFSQDIFALVGLADKSLRSKSDIRWSKMLAYSGLLAGRSRSPQMVAGIIGHCFDLKNVTVNQWQLRYVTIPKFQQTQIGLQNFALGNDTMLGERVADRASKFSVCIGSLTKQRFNDFLPNGKDYKRLVQLVEFVLREQMAYDIELTMAEPEVPAFILKNDSETALGWTSFLSHEPVPVTIQVRQ